MCDWWFWLIGISQGRLVCCLWDGPSQSVWSSVVDTCPRVCFLFALLTVQSMPTVDWMDVSVEFVLLTYGVKLLGISEGESVWQLSVRSICRGQSVHCSVCGYLRSFPPAPLNISGDHTLNRHPWEVWIIDIGRWAERGGGGVLLFLFVFFKETCCLSDRRGCVGLCRFARVDSCLRPAHRFQLGLFLSFAGSKDGVKFA